MGERTARDRLNAAVYERPQPAAGHFSQGPGDSSSEGQGELMNPILISRDRQGGKTYELIQQIGRDLSTDPDLKAVVILHDHQSSHWFLDYLHRHLPSHVAERVETAHPGYNRPMFNGRSGGLGYADNVDMIDDGIYHPIFTDLQRSRFELRAITYTPEHGHPGRNYRKEFAREALRQHSQARETDVAAVEAHAADRVNGLLRRPRKFAAPDTGGAPT